FDHFQPYLEAAMKRMPVLGEVGLRKFFSGPESFTPDTNTLLGEIPDFKNLFVCAGLNSIGIGSGGGVGKVTAEWLMNGHINEDLFIYDIKRFQKFHSDINFITQRITETLGDLYGMHWPYKQHKTSRNIKLLPYHEELKKAGACFGAAGGYERPMWYSRNGKANYDYSYNFQNWYPSAEFETKNTVTNVGLYELTPFSKFELKGDNVHEELQKICTANVKNEIGKCTYTQMLNSDGGIETDLTVVCISENHYRLIGAAATRERDKFHIKKHINQNIRLTDVTDDYVCLGIFGPKSRELMKDISGEDFSSDNLSFGNSKNIKIGNSNVWVQRLSYVGEIGYELYINNSEAKLIFNKIIDIGKKFSLSLCGAHAMDTLRMESGFLHWGHDISPEENQLEAGLNFAISFKKNYDFIGKQALLKIDKNKIKKKFIMLTLDNTKPGEPLALHFEPIYIDGKICGNTTSANYSFNYNKNLLFGYVSTDLKVEQLLEKKIQVEIEKVKYDASLLLKPLKDPKIKLN
ncbi:sarcosine dehydrogenase, partial [Candidatus Pelagibacter sp.]|nr:sarcosine dehydrogenase [Candidatus Pelagibacter sp.]